MIIKTCAVYILTFYEAEYVVDTIKEIDIFSIFYKKKKQKLLKRFDTKIKLSSLCFVKPVCNVSVISFRGKNEMKYNEIIKWKDLSKDAK